MNRQWHSVSKHSISRWGTQITKKINKTNFSHSLSRNEKWQMVFVVFLFNCCCCFCFFVSWISVQKLYCEGVFLSVRFSVDCTHTLATSSEWAKHSHTFLVLFCVFLCCFRNGTVCFVVNVSSPIHKNDIDFQAFNDKHHRFRIKRSHVISHRHHLMSFSVLWTKQFFSIFAVRCVDNVCFCFFFLLEIYFCSKNYINEMMRNTIAKPKIFIYYL